MVNYKYLFSFIAGSAAILFADTITVGGNITTSTSWTTDTVIVVDTVTVDSTVVLTIDAGTVIDFQSNYIMHIYGRILANGTDDSRILFTTADTLVGWGGMKLYLRGSASESTHFEYCKIENVRSRHGGALHLRYSGRTVTIQNCEFSNNISEGSGGGMYINTYSQVNIFNTAFFKNRAVNGSAVCLFQSGNTITMSNVLFADNTAADNGGAVWSSWTSPQMNNITMVNNTGCGYTGSAYARTVFMNSILAGNRPTQVYLNYESSDPDFFYCIVQGSHESFEGIGSGSEYSSNADSYAHNLDTVPQFTDTAGNDFSLQANSPGINAGSPFSDTLMLPDQDIVGGHRFRDSIIDIGAYEYQDGAISVKQDPSVRLIPSLLISSVPNPFSTHTIISFRTTNQSLYGKRVNLSLYNARGKHIRTLFSGRIAHERFSVEWNGKNSQNILMPAGMYLCRIKIGDEINQLHRILLKR